MLEQALGVHNAPERSSEVARTLRRDAAKRLGAVALRWFGGGVETRFATGSGNGRSPCRHWVCETIGRLGPTAAIALIRPNYNRLLTAE